MNDLFSPARLTSQFFEGCELLQNLADQANQLRAVKPRKEEPRKLRTSRLFLKILYPLVKNQCQGVFEWMFLIKGY